jgi:uncharacterized caspase-like protein
VVTASAKRRSYLIPLDSDIWNEEEIQSKGISLEEILAQMNESGADVKIAIIDAARRNPFERRFRSGGAEGLAPVSAPVGSLVLYSANAGSPGGLVKDNDMERSFLVGELLKEIRSHELSAEEVFRRASRGVLQRSLNEQTPWISSSLGPTFSFASCASTVTAPASPPITNAPDPSARAAGDAVTEPSRLAKAQAGARAHEGWIIQVGGFDAESDAQRMLLIARAKVGNLLDKADSFTEPVMRGEKTLYRARFAGFREKEDAEEACRQLKLKDVDCMTIRP